jgi:phosphate transport system permease protein
MSSAPRTAAGAANFLPATRSFAGSHANVLWRRWKNRVIIGLMGAALALAILPLVSVLWTLAAKGLPHVSSDLLLHNASEDASKPGIANAITGSLSLLLVAAAVSIPLGLAVGIYLSQRGNGRLGMVVRILLDVMSGIPAIIVGVFVYTVVVRKHGDFSLHVGYSMFAGGLALGMIMLPIFARMSEEAMRQIPGTVEEAGLGLGLTRRKVITRIILRAAMPAVLTGAFLALSRVAGEAAPLLFTAFGTFNSTPTTVDEPVWSLPVALYQYFDLGTDRLNQAWAASVVLVVMILALRLIMNFYTRRRYGGAQAHV